MNRKLLNMHRNLTRGQFEKLLGGEFAADPEQPRLRVNHHWETWTGRASGRPAKFARSLRSGRTKSAPTWGELARKLGLRRNGRGS
ncbi:MAG: hypothetical protein ACOC9X_05325 [bacterium]